MENNIDFKISYSQAEKICNYFGKSILQLEPYEICELLDRVIDSLIVEE